MALTDKFLVLERPHFDRPPTPEFNGVQRLYRLPNGYGLSAVNSPALHIFPFAWEIAVVTNMTEAGRFDSLSYDTPLTDDVEVFDTDEEANAFIERAAAWAEKEAA